MIKLALTFPGFKESISNLPIKDGATNTAIAGTNKIGDVVTGFLNVGFLISGFLLVFWLSWGIFQYIFASGEKEKLAKARARITWALVGFLVIIIAFALSSYVQKFFPARTNQSVTPVSEPDKITPTAPNPNAQCGPGQYFDDFQKKCISPRN